MPPHFEQLAREDKIARLIEAVKERNQFVSGSTRAKPEAGLKQLESRVKQHKISSFVDLYLENDQIKMVVDEKKQEEDKLLDGCYVVETDVSNDKMNKKNVWDRYGDLNLIEVGKERIIIEGRGVLPGPLRARSFPPVWRP